MKHKDTHPGVTEVIMQPKEPKKQVFIVEHARKKFLLESKMEHLSGKDNIDHNEKLYKECLKLAEHLWELEQDYWDKQ